MMQLLACQDANAWNEFLEIQKNQQLVTIAHNPCLGPILAKTFGYKHQNFWLEKDGQKIGVLPTVQIGEKKVSMPHFSYGGPVVDNNEENPLRLKKVLQKNKFEARSFFKLSNFYCNKKVTCIVKLKPSKEEQFKLFKSQMRRKLRKTSKYDFNTLHGGIELLDDFYEVFSKKMLEKGSPPLGKVFFENLLNEYKYGKVQITVVYMDGNVAAAGFALSYLGFNEMCWASSNKKYDTYNANSELYWSMIKDSIANGYEHFSMGRSTVNSGNHYYKKQWSPIEMPIYFNYSEPVGRSLKEYKFLTKIWKLQPLRTSVYFGHFISKYVY